MSSTPASVTAVVPLTLGAVPAVAVISKDQPSNGLLRICLRANDDPASDSHATFYVHDGTQIDRSTKELIPATTPADIQAWVAQEKARVAREYSAMALAHRTLLDAINT